MDKVPVLYEIVKFLSIKDAFTSFIRVNKKFHSVLEGEQYLCRYIEAVFHIPRTLNYPRDKSIAFLKEALKSMKDKPVEMYGFATTGGVQDQNKSNWVFHVFSSDLMDMAYRSGPNKLNINTAAVLASSQFELRNQLKTMCDLLKAPIEKLPFYLTKSSNFDRFLGDIRQIYTQSTSLSEQGKSTLGECYTLARTFTFDLMEIARDADSQYSLTSPVDVISANAGLSIFITKHILVSKHNSETNSVKTVMVFVSDTYVDVNSHEFGIYDDLTTSDSLDILEKQRISGLKRKYGLSYRTFAWSSDNLKPVLWGVFHSASSVLVELDAWFTGSYVYAKLIDSEISSDNPTSFSVHSLNVKVRGQEINFT